MTTRNRRPRLLLVFAAVLAWAPAALTASREADPPKSDAPPFFDKIGSHSRTVTTDSPEAQRYFNHGLVWMFSFNHDEAIRSFTYATTVDPNCAMAWWGIAICNGPHINNPTMSEPGCRAAWDALSKAVSLKDRCTAPERALIEALQARYVDPKSPPGGEGKLPLDAVARASLDKAYADAMAKAYKQFPTDTDIATMYAESLMDLKPWDLWSVTGEPRPDTPEIVRVLQQVLAADPNHPGANHYYIHAVEASPHPELANDAADRLRTLVPDSGHMVHMPSHIDVRTGRWNLAADQNEAAILVHDQYVKVSPRQGLYRAYMFHNDHFLAFACMMAGRQKDAAAAAKQMAASIPEEFYRDFAPVADAYSSIAVEVPMRFGRWDDVLAVPEPRQDLPITRAMWRFARSVAHAAKGDVSAAREEQINFRSAIKAVPAGAMMAINPAETVLKLADEFLEGEILYRQGDVDGAIKRLQAAATVEDTLVYIEPPDWVQPVRHTLGAVLTKAKRYAEAEDVYREDLRRWPENGWSLHGMVLCSEGAGKAEQAADFQRRLDKAWSRADTKLSTSCFCVTNGD